MPRAALNSGLGCDSLGHIPRLVCRMVLLPECVHIDEPSRSKSKTIDGSVCLEKTKLVNCLMPVILLYVKVQIMYKIVRQVR